MYFLLILLLLVPHNLHATQTNYTQTVQLRPVSEGWNLVSWHVVPVDYTGFYMTMEDILPDESPLNDWFWGNDDNKLYKWDEADLSYPQYYPTSYGWEWDLDNSYLIEIDEPAEWGFADRELFDDNHTISITPFPAWDDDLESGRITANGWFFIGYSAKGYSKLGSVYDDPENPTGDNCEYVGPFHWMIWEETGQNQYEHRSGTVAQQYLAIVRTDDGRVFIPPNPNNDPMINVDQIGVLEPGRGYFLGFYDDDTSIDFYGWSDYPGWTSNSIPPDPKTNQTQIASANHFRYMKQTQWSYTVVIDTVDLEDTPMETGDEIGVFDGNLCVGCAIYTGKFPVVISCWKDDISTPGVVDGYIAGNEMIFKWYDVSENSEAVFELPPMTAASEPVDRVIAYSEGFGAGIYALRSMVYGIKGMTYLPKEFNIGQNYPNPFNAETVIPLELPQRSIVRVELYNVRGRYLGTIHEGVENAGWPRIRYNAAHLPSGVYFYRITAEGLERSERYSDIGKMLYLK